jgi:hypothetical protein
MRSIAGDATDIEEWLGGGLQVGTPKSAGARSRRRSDSAMIG